MSRPIIAVDMDDVIWDLMTSWVNFLNREYGLNVNPDSIRGWSVPEVFPTLTEDQVYAPLSDWTMWADVEPMPGACEYLKKLLDKGYNIYLVTATAPENVEYKFRLIQQHFPFISWNNVVVMQNKKLFRADALVDDGPHNLEDAPCIRILFSRRNNEYYDATAHGIIRAHDWKEVHDLIVQLFPNNK